MELINEVAEFSQSEVGENILVNITNATLDGSDKTNYSISLTDAPTAIASILTVTGIYNTSNHNLKVYPNPFSDYIYFRKNKFSKATLLNLAGQKVMEKNIQGKTVINVKEILPGVYFLIFKNKKNEKQIFKITKH